MKKIILLLIASAWFILPFGNVLKAKEINYTYRIEYFYDGIENRSLAEVNKAQKGSLILSYPNKSKDGYEIFYSTIDEDGLTITDHLESNLIRVYYIKIGEGDNKSYQQTFESAPKTGIFFHMKDSASPFLFIISILIYLKSKSINS